MHDPAVVEPAASSSRRQSDTLIASIGTASTGCSLSTGVCQRPSGPSGLSPSLSLGRALIMWRRDRYRLDRWLIVIAVDHRASGSSVARLRCELLTAGQLEPPADGRITMTVPFAAVMERFVTGMSSRRNVHVLPSTEQWNSWNWPGVPPIKIGEVGVGEAVALDWADGAIAFSACRVPAAYPAARPPRSPVTPRMMATAGGCCQRTVGRQRVGGRSRPCSRMSGPSAASPLDGGYSGRPPLSWLLTSP